MTLFGITTKEWRKQNPSLNGNIRDYASIDELICLANLENLNLVFISDGLTQAKRLEKLNKIAISEIKILSESNMKYLNNNDEKTKNNSN